jgi:acyl homoserine lactone synthase
MIRYIYGDQLNQFPYLKRTMFLDRATQFKERLNWDVTVDAAGEERDEYDRLNPIYAIWQDPATGRHGGSMRGLPTTGRTMTAEHFRHLTDGVHISSPLIWEVTRFCLAPDAEPRVAGALMLASCEMALRFGIEQGLGVFDARMIRIYRRLGFSPEVLGTCGEGREAISVGLWTFTEEAREIIAMRAGFTLEAAACWFDDSFYPHAQMAEVA